MFKVITTEADRLRVFAVRAIVFVEEQACPYDLEFDEFDGEALHILGEDQGEPVAAARIRFLDDYAKLERIAIRRSHRGRGLGHDLVEFMVDTARHQGFTRYKMHAQAHLVDFYRGHGFEPHGERFSEANIEHYLMTRDDSMLPGVKDEPNAAPLAP